MSDPIWIEEQVVLAFHDATLQEHGGLAGLRDYDLLQSALNRPRNLYHYNDPNPSLYQLAASYAFGLATNHPFLDGSKRAAFAVAAIFLWRNGLELTAPEAEAVVQLLELITSKRPTDDKLEHYAEWLRLNTKVTRTYG